MSEPKSLNAAYDPGRGERGRFIRGNKASVGWNTEVARRFQQVQAAWLDAVTVDDMTQVAAELKWLAMQRDDLQTKMKALAYFLDRQLGRPREHLNVTTTDSTPAPVLDLRPDEVAVLERLVQRTDMIVDVDAVVVEKGEDA